MTDKKSHNMSNNVQNNIPIPQKYLDKIIKMQQDQESVTRQEFELLRIQLAQTNALLSDLIAVSGSGSTVASSKKIVPFHTGSQDVGQLIVRPSNPDDYPTKIDIYKINDNRVIPHMTLVNDGPGDIFFINAYAKDVFNEREGHLNVNDQRELFNVYEIRLRATLPLTTIRLIEGIFRTGSVTTNVAFSTTTRPIVQPNEILVLLDATFDNHPPTIDITVPAVNTIPAEFSAIPGEFLPLPPGQTATLVSSITGEPMPLIIPEGFVFETFAFFANLSTDFTTRTYFQFFPGVFSLNNVFPASNRGEVLNFVPNLQLFSTINFDTFGAPPGGRGFLVTVTNDDPFNNMVGEINLTGLLRRIT